MELAGDRGQWMNGSTMTLFSQSKQAMACYYGFLLLWHPCLRIKVIMAPMLEIKAHANGQLIVIGSWLMNVNTCANRVGVKVWHTVQESGQHILGQDTFYCIVLDLLV